MRFNSIITSVVATACVTFLGATVANADFAIAGEWYRNNGPTVNIPPGQFDGPCGTAATVDVPFVAAPITGANRAPGPCVRHQIPLPAGASPATFVSAVVGLPQSGIPAPLQLIPAATGASVVATNATVRIPPSIFNRAASSQIPVPANPAVQQLDTTFIFKGPSPLRAPSANQNTRQLPGIAAQTRLMQKNAWNGAGQTGRANADFVVAYSNTAFGLTRQVTYTTKGDKFGGTMGMLLDGVGVVYAAAQIIPGGGKEMIISPLGDPTLLFNTVHNGRGYNTTQVRNANPAPFASGYTLTTRAWTATTSNGNPTNGNTTTAGGPFPNVCTQTFPPKPIPCDLIAAIGAVAGSLPPGSTINTGFPWTTGHVSAYAHFQIAGQDQTSTLTAEGSDSVTNGVRTLNLVSAGFAQRNAGPTSGRTPHVDVVTIQLPEPGSTMALMGALGLIGGLYGVRRKLF